MTLLSSLASSRRFFSLISISVLPLSVMRAADTESPLVILVSIDGLPAEYFDLPAVEMPLLHEKVKSGARAQRMIGVYPSVTWTNHTSMVTGVTPARHGVIGNNYYDRTTGQDVDFIRDLVFDQKDAVKVPTIYDVAHEAGLKTAGIAWPATRNAPALDWQMPFTAETEAMLRYTTPSLLDALSELGVASEKKFEWSGTDAAGRLLWDWMHTQLAKHVILAHQPNLLLLHLDGVDSLHHRNGRNSPEAYWACQTTDQYLRTLVDAVESAGLTARTTFFVVSDHGFRNYTKQINLRIVLAEAGLLKIVGPNRVIETSAHLLTIGSSSGIYITDDINRTAVIADLLPRLRAVEGVDAVFSGDDLIVQGMGDPAEDSRVPDIMVSAEDGYAFYTALPGQDLITSLGKTKGAHGALPDQSNMYASFFAWGAAIKPGTVVPRVYNLDIAPTIAAALGVALPDVDGRVLSEILREPPGP